MKKYKNSDDVEVQSLQQCSNIESNVIFNLLLQKTQVESPRNDRNAVVKNRLTHSYEVKTSSLMIAINIARQNKISSNEIDYKGSLAAVSLLHDIGHPPFGHDGSSFINDFMIAAGLPEGFSDNNNNLVAIEHNEILVSSYTKASTIKYPDKLYPNQKRKYLPMLNKAIEHDKEHFKKYGYDLVDQTTTIACQIMDEADRNSYTCSDIADFLCLGNTIDVDKLQALASDNDLACRYSEINTLSKIITTGTNETVKVYFNDLKNRFNANYKLSNDGIVVIDEELEEYREFLSLLCREFFINFIRVDEFHLKNMKRLRNYILDVFDNGYFSSEKYERKILKAKNSKEKLRLMRDMISESSDWCILCYDKEKNS